MSSRRPGFAKGGRQLAYDICAPDWWPAVFACRRPWFNGMRWFKTESMGRGQVGSEMLSLAAIMIASRPVVVIWCEGVI